MRRLDEINDSETTDYIAKAMNKTHGPTHNAFSLQILVINHSHLFLT